MLKGIALAVYNLHHSYQLISEYGRSTHDIAGVELSHFIPRPIKSKLFINVAEVSVGIGDDKGALGQSTVSGNRVLTDRDTDSARNITNNGKGFQFLRVIPDEIGRSSFRAKHLGYNPGRVLQHVRNVNISEHLFVNSEQAFMNRQLVRTIVIPKWATATIHSFTPYRINLRPLAPTPVIILHRVIPFRESPQYLAADKYHITRVSPVVLGYFSRGTVT